MAVKKPLVLTAGQIQELQSGDEINIDASDVTTGTIATARLGTGTANSTTYLAGDQTYKAAVTSVNGSTGAITVAAGDTTYTVTTADVENTSTKTRVISVTIPANTWVDGECITIELVREVNNATGTAQNCTTYIGGTTITESSSSGSINNFVSSQWKHKYQFFRIGSGVFYSRVFSTAMYEPYSTGFNIFGQTMLLIDIAVTFTSDIELYIDCKFDTASPSLYQRISWARAYKRLGQL